MVQRPVRTEVASLARSIPVGILGERRAVPGGVLLAEGTPRVLPRGPPSLSSSQPPPGWLLNEAWVDVTGDLAAPAGQVLPVEKVGTPVCQDRHPGARTVGSLGEADKQSVMEFAMSNPALVLRRANYHSL